MSSSTIRLAVQTDCPQLLTLMKKLAEFEHYIDDFKVTEQELIDRGFSNQPEFFCIVSESQNNLNGYLVYYFIPFTYDLKPTLFIKELYVSSDARGLGIGKSLFKFAIEQAKKHGCGRLKWDVLNDNKNAQHFYKKLGAKHNKQWQGYQLDI